METIEELEKELKEIQATIQLLMNNGGYKDYIKELISEGETNIKSQIAQLRTGTTPDTEIFVRFPDKNLTIRESTSRETYKKAIEEFGVNEVYQKFPKLFMNNSDGNNTIKVDTNKYLVVGLSNAVKKRKIKSISTYLNRNAYVYFSLA